MGLHRVSYCNAENSFKCFRPQISPALFFSFCCFCCFCFLLASLPFCSAPLGAAAGRGTMPKVHHFSSTVLLVSYYLLLLYYQVSFFIYYYYQVQYCIILFAHQGVSRHSGFASGLSTVFRIHSLKTRDGAGLSQSCERTETSQTVDLPESTVQYSTV